MQGRNRPGVARWITETDRGWQGESHGVTRGIARQAPGGDLGGHGGPRRTRPPSAQLLRLHEAEAAHVLLLHRVYLRLHLMLQRLHLHLHARVHGRAGPTRLHGEVHHLRLKRRHVHKLRRGLYVCVCERDSLSWARGGGTKGVEGGGKDDLGVEGWRVASGRSQ